MVQSNYTLLWRASSGCSPFAHLGAEYVMTQVDPKRGKWQLACRANPAVTLLAVSCIVFGGSTFARLGIPLIADAGRSPFPVSGFFASRIAAPGCLVFA